MFTKIQYLTPEQIEYVDKIIEEEKLENFEFDMKKQGIGWVRHSIKYRGKNMVYRKWVRPEHLYRNYNPLADLPILHYESITN